ncbi:hypothetical protein [Rubritalea sp.]|uniref:hypothetical protein n=1 Tax=Rubritalea sp. TaxID=2109375 RepID=UPI003EF4489C
MVFVTSADGEEAIDAISYEELKSDSRKAARELKKLLAEREDAAEEAQQEEKRKLDTAVLAEEQAWTNKEGKTITAAIKSADQTSVIFLINKKKITYPFSELSADSQNEIKKLLK